MRPGTRRRHGGRDRWRVGRPVRPGPKRQAIQAEQEAHASALPSGTITFLFTDVVGSTSGWIRDPAGTGAALARHDALVERVVAEHHGHVVRPRGEGDSRFAVFARASDAVASGCAMQLALVEEPWPLAEPLRVRIAVHTGEADLRLGDYYGPAVNHCARLRTVAHGQQVLVSAVTADLVREALPTGIGLRDLGMHQLRDLEQPERVWQLVHERLPAAFPPLRSEVPAQHNLPLQLTNFIGRDRERAELTQLLLAARAVTLTGPGGAGKTRLAVQVALDLLDAFPDGIWLVEVAAIADAELVPEAIAATLRVRVPADQSPVAMLQEALADKAMLVVLDNCERNIAACAEVVTSLLQTGSDLRVLITSREILRVNGEVVWRLPALMLEEAERLFVDRVMRVQPGFALTDANVTAVTQICQRLDGMPLAIELAAARARSLSTEELADRLNDRFRLLTSSVQGAPTRQQTLRGAVDWSYELLETTERELFNRLAAFANGFTLEAAERVCSEDGVAAEEVLDLLARLVDKSLVMVDVTGQQARYRLLDTLHSYAEEKLAADPAHVETLNRRHAIHFVALAEAAQPEMWGPDQAQWQGRLERDHDNARKALSWCVAHRETELALRLGGALARFWQRGGYLVEARVRISELLDLPEADRWPALQADLMATAALVAAYDSRHGEARRLGMHALAIARADGGATIIARVLYWLGLLAWLSGDHMSASCHSEEGTQISRLAGNRQLEALNLFVRSAAAADAAESADAHMFARSSLKIFSELRYVRGTALVLVTLGRVAIQLGDYDQARALLGDALERFRTTEFPVGVAWCTGLLAWTSAAQGNAATAREEFRVAIGLCRQAGLGARLPWLLEGLAEVAAVEGQAEQAVRLAAAAASHRRQLSARASPAERAQLRRWLVPVWQQLGIAVFRRAWWAGGAQSLEEALSEGLRS